MPSVSREERRGYVDRGDRRGVLEVPPVSGGTSRGRQDRPSDGSAPQVPPPGGPSPGRGWDRPVHDLPRPARRPDQDPRALEGSRFQALPGLPSGALTMLISPLPEESNIVGMGARLPRLVRVASILLAFFSVGRASLANQNPIVDSLTSSAVALGGGRPRSSRSRPTTRTVRRRRARRGVGATFRGV